MTDAKIEELKQRRVNSHLKDSDEPEGDVWWDLLDYAESLTSQLSAIRDAGDVEVERLTNEIQYQLRTVDIIKLRDIAISRGQQIATLAAERDEARKELAALRSAPQMAEVNALWAMWLKTRPPDDEPVVEDLVDLARQTILAYEREKRRADEAEKEARRVECCTCGHEMVEVDGQFGCEHCDHEYDQTCECPTCHQTRERESAQSRIATLTSERDELESMRKEDIKAVLCLQSEIERLLAKVEHKKQQLEIDAVNQAAEWAKESGA